MTSNTWRLAIGAVAALVFSMDARALASPGKAQEAMVKTGRPLRVMLDRRVRIGRIGQPVTATLIEPVYAFDRVVIPEGAKVLGHIARIDGESKGARVIALLGGNFTPNRVASLEFDVLVLPDGSEVKIQTRVNPGTAHVIQEVAGGQGDGIAARARREVAQRARHAISAVKRPGKAQRLKPALVNRLPYHPQHLEAGTIFDAELLSPLVFGRSDPVEFAPPGTMPPPESILNARLLTGLDSAKSEHGAVVRAVLTQPVFSAAHQLILPEGTVLTGKVTFLRAARRFRRNGQLRFLFETMEIPGADSQALQGALYAAEASSDQRLVIDEEGGASISNSKSRFLAPAIAGAAALVAVDHTEISDEGMGALTTEANVVGRGVKGLSGFGLAGVGLTFLSRPAAVAFGAYGVARAVYVSLLGKGHDVVFPADTPIQIQLAPGGRSTR